MKRLSSSLFNVFLMLLSRALFASWLSMVTRWARLPQCLGKPEREVLKKTSVFPSTTEEQGRTRCPVRGWKESRIHNRIWNWKHIRIQFIQLWSDFLKVTRYLGGQDTTRTQVSSLSTALCLSLPTAPNPRSQLGTKEDSISKLSLFAPKPSLLSLPIFLLQKLSSTYK